ncbi:MAG: hypothetical protein ABSC65_20940 [Acidobacteriaceae bacterium]|jgi:hypothetical protein
MAGKSLALTTLLFMLTACRQQQLSLPVTHAAMSQGSNSAANPGAQGVYQPAASQSCYSYILLRPKDQRATAVQARLRKTDQLAAAFGARKVSVDLLGDHANILSLTFPVVWPVQQAYFDGISSVVDEYFSSPEVQDYMCNSGFDEVRLSARGQNDRRIHPIWTARVTSEGLVKDPPLDQVSDLQLAAR